MALLVLSSLGVEFMSGKQVEKLPRRLWYYGQAWISCLLNDLDRTVILSDTRGFTAAPNLTVLRAP